MADGSIFPGVSLRLPPQNLQAEQALLGALLARNQAYERVADILEAKHFADPVNGRIYRRIAERILDGHLADAVSMKADFENSGILDEVGGTAYLAQLLGAMVAINTVRDYALAIIDCWLRRQLIDVGEIIVAEAFGAEPSQTGRAQLESAEKALSALGSHTSYSSRLVSGGEAIRLAVEQAEERHRSGVPSGLISGIPTLDKAFSGAGPGTLTLLAGLQGSGKTALMGQLAKAIGLRVMDSAVSRGMTPEQAQHEPGVAIFSLEASAEEIGLRLAAHEADMDGRDLMTGNLDMVAASNLSRALTRTRHMAVRIHDCVATPFRLLAPKIIMHLQRQPELAVAIDHLLVMGDDEPDSRGRSSGGLDPASVAKLTRQLKALAKRLGVPFIVLTHVPRPLKDGPVRRPTKWDVKWAGEGDADNVIFVHRPIMLMSDTPPVQGRQSDDLYKGPNGPLDRWYKERASMAEVAELVVAKTRGGPEAVHRMRWDGPRTALREWDWQPEPVADAIPEWVL